MLNLKHSQIQPIGVDIGCDSVRMIQLAVTGTSLSVVAATRQSLPDEARQQPELALPMAMDLVRQMLRGGDFVGRKVVAALPRQIVHVKNLRLPVMPPSEIESAVQFEAKNIFSLETEQAVVRHLTAGEVRQGADTRLEVIALAAQKNEIDDYIEQLNRAGCIIESLDFQPSALYRGVERYIRRREDENDVFVLVDVGVKESRVVIGRGRDISFFKTIEIGAGHFRQRVSLKLGITDDEARALRRRQIESAFIAAGPETVDPVRQAVQDASRGVMEELAREISLCLRYYSVTFRGQRPSKVRLFGGEGGDPQLLSILSGALPIPVEVGKPLFSVDVSRMKHSERTGYMNDWAVAFGLGLKLTNTYFGARDGKSRQAPPTPADDAQANVEVVDLSQAVNARTAEVANA